jgi:hypothetical protein
VLLKSDAISRYCRDRRVVLHRSRKCEENKIALADCHHIAIYQPGGRAAA